MKIYTIDEILKALPHRYPFLLIDRFEVTEKGKTGTGYKNVTINEPFFEGHFPANPVMPGVLQIEAMAQAAGMLVFDEDEKYEKKNVLFMGVDKVKFRQQVKPGDVLEMKVEKMKQHRNVYQFFVKTFVRGTVVSEAELLASVF